jgi:hypothetical protein
MTLNHTVLSANTRCAGIIIDGVPDVSTKGSCRKQI